MTGPFPLLFQCVFYDIDDLCSYSDSISSLCQKLHPPPPPPPPPLPSPLQGPIMCKSQITQQSLIMYYMSFAIWHDEGPAQLWFLQELKSDLCFDLCHWLKPLTDKKWEEIVPASKNAVKLILSLSTLSLDLCHWLKPLTEEGRQYTVTGSKNAVKLILCLHQLYR